MPTAEGFLELAGIGGVFVGFAALIAVRGGAQGAAEVGYMRGVVTIGMLSIVAALAPVTLARYAITEHDVWALSSAVVLGGEFILFGAMARTPEYRANWRSELRGARARPKSSLPWTAMSAAAYALYMAVVTLAPIVILSGALRDVEAALFFTVVVMLLLGAGWALLVLVYSKPSQDGA